MNLLLYNIGIFLYGIAIRVASLWDKKAAQWISGRKNILKIIDNDFVNGGTKKNMRIWFHCASLGEFEQAKPVIELFKKENKSIEIILTFFSPSGYGIRKNHPLATYVYYLPSDTKYNAEKFISIIMPDIAIFVKYEFWYHFLITLKKKKIPVFLISAVFNRNQVFFRGYGKFFKKMLDIFTHIFVQNESSLNVLSHHSISNITVAGDTRFDRVRILAGESFPEEEKLKKFIQSMPVLVAGSVWEKDMRTIIPLINQFTAPLKVIIASHEIGESQIRQIEFMTRKKTIRYSKFNNNDDYEYPVLILDIIGILGKIYRLADIAYIGGAFGKGLHNILEPAAYGTPVIFGPHYNRFPEAIEMIKRGTGFSVPDSGIFSETFLKLYNDTPLRKRIFQEQIKYVEENYGAAEKVWRRISELR